MVVCDNGCRRHSVCDHSVLRQPHSRLRNKHLHSRLAINNYTHGKIQQLRSRQRATTTLTARSATTLTAKDAKQPTSGETFSSFAASVVAVSVARKLNPVPGTGLRYWPISVSPSHYHSFLSCGRVACGWISAALPKYANLTLSRKKPASSACSRNEFTQMQVSTKIYSRA